MEAFTKGPWLVGNRQVGPKIDSDDQSDGMMMPVAYIEQFDYPEEYEANARLIAAAPDLLEALEYFVNRESAIQSKFDLYGPSDIASGMRMKFEQARAAVAKAKGES